MFQRVVALILLAGSTWAQQQSTGGGTTNPPTQPTNPSPPTTTSGRGTSTQQPTQPQTQDNRPIFITGLVALDDGSPLPRNVVVERVCATRVYREGYADSKGYFSLQLGQNQSVLADASTEFGGFGGTPGMNTTAPIPGFGQSPNTSGGFDNMLFGCELRANASGFRSDSIALFNIRYMDNPNVGTIILHRIGPNQGLTTSATSGLAPKDARKALEKGKEAIQKGNPDEAQKQFLKATELYPKFAEAWVELGQVYERRSHAPEARDAYQRAVTADGSFVTPYVKLYQIAMRESQWKEVVELTDKVLRLNPYEFGGAYYVNALANLQLKNLDAAEKSAKEAVKVKGKQAEPRSNYLLGYLLAQKGDLDASAESLSAYLKMDAPANDKEQAQKLLNEVDAVRKQRAAAGPRSEPTAAQ